MQFRLKTQPCVGIHATFSRWFWLEIITFESESQSSQNIFECFESEASSPPPRQNDIVGQNSL